MRALWRCKAALLIVLSFAACIPAQQPPQLAHTPGAPVVVADGRAATAAFSARYPADWRVITGPAAQPPLLIFAAPDGCALIVLAAEAIDPPPLATCADSAAPRRETRQLSGANGAIYATLNASSTAWEAFLLSFESVLDSIESF